MHVVVARGLHRPHVGRWQRLSLSYAVVTGALCLPVGAQPYREAMPLGEAPITAGDFLPRSDGVVWERKIPARNALYVRVHFANISSPPGGDYEVVVRGWNEKALARFDAQQFARQPEMWTGVLFSPGVIVQVQAQRVPVGLSFVIDKVVRQVEPQGRLTPQSTVPNWKSLDELSPRDPAIDLARSVAKLYISEGWVCTAFIVAPGRLLTNFHCLAKSGQYQKGDAADRCSDIEAYFDFDRQAQPDSAVHTKCLDVLAGDELLDYALLKFDDSAVATGAQVRPPVRLASGMTGPAPVFIIHHPAGLATKVSTDCRLFPTTAPGSAEHDCSTTGGSSGAPIFLEDGTVVALHFDGAYPERMTVGQIEAAIAKGEVFRNKARPIALVREAIGPLLP
jgi:hypothetical protein